MDSNPHVIKVLAKDPTNGIPNIPTDTSSIRSVENQLNDETIGIDLEANDISDTVTEKGRSNNERLGNGSKTNASSRRKLPHDDKTIAASRKKQPNYDNTVDKPNQGVNTTSSAPKGVASENAAVATLVDDVENNGEGIVELVDSFGQENSYGKTSEIARSGSHSWKLTSSSDSSLGSSLVLWFQEDLRKFKSVSYWFYRPYLNRDHFLSLQIFFNNGSVWEWKETPIGSSKGHLRWMQAVFPLDASHYIPIVEGEADSSFDLSKVEGIGLNSQTNGQESVVYFDDIELIKFGGLPQINIDEPSIISGPIPVLLSVEGIQEEARAGQEITVTVKAINNGTIGGRDSAINVSMLFDDRNNADSLNISNVSAYPDFWNDYAIIREPGNTIFNNKCEKIPASLDYIVEVGTDRIWGTGDENSMSFTIIPKRPGKLLLRTRVTLSKQNFGCEFVSDVSIVGAEQTTDQQGWEVAQFSVNIKPSPLPVDMITFVDGAERNGIIEHEKVKSYGAGSTFIETNDPIFNGFYSWKLKTSDESAWGSLSVLPIKEDKRDLSAFDTISFWFYTPDENSENSISFQISFENGSTWEWNGIVIPSSKGYNDWYHAKFPLDASKYLLKEGEPSQKYDLTKVSDIRLVSNVKQQESVVYFDDIKLKKINHLNNFDPINVVDDEGNGIVDHDQESGIVDYAYVYGLGSTANENTENVFNGSYAWELATSNESPWRSLLELSFKKDLTPFNTVSFWFRAPDEKSDNFISFQISFDNGSIWEWNEALAASSEGFSDWYPVEFPLDQSKYIRRKQGLSDSSFDLKKVSGFGLVSHASKQDTIVYFDEIRLKKINRFSD